MSSAARQPDLPASVSQSLSSGTAHDARFVVDGIRPARVSEPASEGELADLLSTARNERNAVIPAGGGTRLGLGNAPSAYNLAVSTGRLDRIIAYEPGDMTVTVQPGVRLSTLQSHLAAHHQFLPLDPAGDERSTVGGVVGANASGPFRHAHGTVRDWLIGIRVAHADGTVSAGGGRVVKNVSGYDMPKLYVGSIGTLGVISEMTFKLAPLPPEETAVQVACRSAGDAAALILRANDAGLAIHAAELLSPDAARHVISETAWTVLLRVAGVSRGVQRSLRDLRTLAADAGTSIKERPAGAVWPAWAAAFAPRALSARISLLPSDVAPAIDAITTVLGQHAAAISATVAGGVIRVVVDPPPTDEAMLVARLRAAIDTRGGTLLVDAASTATKREIDVFGPPRPEFAITKRLKELFDPERVLAPGRFWGRL